jgi:hypothetical protein
MKKQVFDSQASNLLMRQKAAKYQLFNGYLII